MGKIFLYPCWHLLSCPHVIGGSFVHAGCFGLPLIPDPATSSSPALSQLLSCPFEPRPLKAERCSMKLSSQFQGTPEAISPLRSGCLRRVLTRHKGQIPSVRIPQTSLGVIVPSSGHTLLRSYVSWSPGSRP